MSALLLLATLASAQPLDEVLPEPVEIWLAVEQPPPTAAHAHDLGVLARLGPWWGPPSDELECGLTVLVPDGFGLDGDPDLALDLGGLTLEVALTRGTGGLVAYELDRCLPSTTPVHVRLVETP